VVGRFGEFVVEPGYETTLRVQSPAQRTGDCVDDPSVRRCQ